MPAVVERARAQRSAVGSVVAALACAGVLLAIATVLHRYGLADLALSRGAVRSWLDGDGLYAYRSPDSHLGTALPPPAAYLLVPAAFLPLAFLLWRRNLR